MSYYVLKVSKIVLLTIAVTTLGFMALGKAACNAVYATSCFAQSPSPAPLQSKELASQYYEYTPQVLEHALTQGRVVLYFWAPWCSTCTSLDSDLQNKKISVPDGVTILRID